MPVRLVARIAALGFLALALFQVALALGAPWGEAAWGGQHEGTLPSNLRRSSALAAVALVGAAALVISASRPASAGPQARTARYVAGVLAFLLLVNAAGNFSSESTIERVVMTPVAVTLAALTGVVAAWPRRGPSVPAPAPRASQPKATRHRRRRKQRGRP